MNCNRLFALVHTFKNSFGSRKTPTPLGVPVKIISPGNNVINLKIIWFLENNVSFIYFLKDYIFPINISIYITLIN